MSTEASETQTGYVLGPLGVLEDFRLRKLPRWMFYTAILAVTASWVPLALIFRARYNTSPYPRIHILQDMDNQTKYRPQDESLIFADGRAMRPKILGTVARGQLELDDDFSRGYTMAGMVDGKPSVKFLNAYPTAIQAQLDNPQQAQTLLLRGQNRFNIYCAVCHGQDGQGQGSVHVRADTLRRNNIPMNWTDPVNLTDGDRRARENGHIFNTITNGIRNMGGYGAVIPVEDRWAIVTYVRTLQFAQTAKESAVPAEKRGTLK